MTTKRNIKGKSAAIFFLIVFSSFYVFNFLCSTGFKEILFSSHNHSTHSHNHESHSHKDSHHHGGGVEQKKEILDMKSDQRISSAESCCENSTLSFFVSLKNSNTIKFGLQKILCTLPLYKELATEGIYKEAVFIKKIEVPLFRPKIPDIRIFIQSFII